MAKQVIGIGTTANDGTGDQVRVAFDKTNQNFTELYDSQLSTSDDLTEGSTNKYLLDDSVEHSKLGTEYKTSISPTFNYSIYTWELDFSSAQVFEFTMTDPANINVSFLNADVGMVKDIIVSGFDPVTVQDYGITLPTGNVISGTYDGSVLNLIQVLVTGPGVYWYTISQIQS